MKTTYFEKLTKYSNCSLLIILIAIMSFSGLSVFGKTERVETFNSIEVQVVGKGNPVILLPALGCSANMWDLTIENVFQNYECYMVNIAGYAGQKAVEQPDFEIVIRDVLDFISKNKLGKVILVGHSFGGNLAMRIALAKPKLFSNLVIVDSYPFSPGVINPDITYEQAKMQAGMIESQLKLLPDSVFNHQQAISYSSMIEDKQIANSIIQEVIKSDRNTICRAYYEIFSTDLRDSLKILDVKAIVLASWSSARQMGRSKSYIQDILNEQYKNLLNCEILIAEKANHFIMFDEPEWFYNSITNFIK